MKPKLTFLLSFTFLILLSGFSLFGEKPEIKREYWENGKLRTETHWKNGFPVGTYFWNENGRKWLEIVEKNELSYKSTQFDEETGKKIQSDITEYTGNGHEGWRYSLVYHKNGKKKSRESCSIHKLGLESCRLKEWDENGKKTYDGESK